MERKKDHLLKLSEHKILTSPKKYSITFTEAMQKAQSFMALREELLRFQISSWLSQERKQTSQKNLKANAWPKRPRQETHRPNHYVKRIKCYDGSALEDVQNLIKKTQIKVRFLVRSCPGLYWNSRHTLPIAIILSTLVQVPRENRSHRVSRQVNEELVLICESMS